MAKKTSKNDIDSYGIDDDLDFSFDESSLQEGFTAESKKDKGKSRSVVGDVLTGFGSGIKDTATSPQFIADSVKKSLPKQYETVFSTIDDTVRESTALYDEAVEALKPGAQSIARKIDRLVPEENATLKKISKKLMKVTGAGDTSPGGDEKGDRVNQTIANELGALFGQKTEQENEVHARDKAEQKIKDKIQDNRDRASITLASDMARDIGAIRTYTDKVTTSFYKKSIELQMRSYFLQADQLKTLQRTSEITQRQLEAVVKNTAMPEFVKMEFNERFRGKMKDKFIDGMFGESSPVNRLFAKIREDSREYLQSFKDTLSMVDDSMGALTEIQEMQGILEDAGMEKQSKKNMAANLAGGAAANWIRDKTTGKIREKLQGTKLDKAGWEAYAKLKNAGGYADEFVNDPDGKVAKYSQELGFKGRAADFAKYIADGLRERDGMTGLDKLGGVETLKDPAIFTSRFVRSVEEVIPSLLGEIHRELQTARTGQDAGTLTYDYDKGKLIARSSLAKTLKTSAAKDMQGGAGYYYADKMFQEFAAGHEVTEDDALQIKRMMGSLALTPNQRYEATDVQKSQGYKDLSVGTRGKVDMMLSGIEGDEYKYRTIASLQDNAKLYRESMTDLRNRIKNLYDLGYEDELVEAGLVTVGSDGKASVDLDSLKKMKLDTVQEQLKIIADSDRTATSDISAKSGVSRIDGGRGKGRWANPMRALQGIKNTKLYNWMYKSGEGDGKEHSGPMAGEVRANLGEDVAPKGKKIDMVNMNGANMAAIQALNAKIEKMGDSATSIDHLSGIRENTYGILEKMGTLSFGLNMNGQAIAELLRDKGMEIGTNLKARASTAGEHLRDLGSSIWGLAEQGLSAGKDTLGKLASAGRKGAGKAWDFTDKNILTKDNKERLQKFSSYAWNKAGEITSSVFDAAKNLVTIQIPSFAKKARDAINKGIKGIANAINGPIDVYLPGDTTATLVGTRMARGMYIDQGTGNKVENINDLLDSKGDITDHEGKVLLTQTDLANGVYDQNGKLIKRVASKLSTLALGAAIGAGSFLKDKLGKGLAGLGNLARGAADSTGNFLKKAGSYVDDKFNLAGIGTGRFDERIYLVLREMRGLMRGEDPERHEDMPAGSADKLTGGGGASKIVRAAGTMIKDKIDSALAPKAPVMVGPQPEMVGPRQSENRANMASLDGLGTGLMKAGKGAIGGVAGALAGMRGGVGWKGKLMGALGGAGTGAAAGFTGSGDPATAEAIDKLKQTVDETKAKVAEKAKGFSFKGLLDGLKSKATTTVGKAGSAVKAFNDRDGDGLREGSWQERYNELERRKAEKAVSRAGDIDTSPKYQDGPSIGSILSKGAGFLSMAGGLLSGAANLLGLGGALSWVKGKFGIGAAAKAAGIAKAAGSITAAGAVAGKAAGKMGMLKSLLGGKWKLLAGLGLGAAGMFAASGAKAGEIAPDDEVDDGSGAKGQGAGGPTYSAGEVQFGDEKGSSLFNGRNAAIAAGAGALGYGGYKALQNRRLNNDPVEKMFDKTGPVKPKMGWGKKAAIGTALGLGAAGLMASSGANAAQAPGQVPEGDPKEKGPEGGGLFTMDNAMTAGEIGLTTAPLWWGAAKKAALGVGRAGAGLMGIGGAAGSSVTSVAGAALRLIPMMAGAVAGSPVLLGGLALAGLGYGAYKLGKYLNRDKVDNYQRVRLMQYGFATNGEIDKHNYRFLALEDYFLDGKMRYDGDRAFVNERAVKMEEVLGIFDVSPTDKEAVPPLLMWLNQRFMPYFCSHVSLLRTLDKKLILNELDKAPKEIKLAYLKKAEFADGPAESVYGPGATPIKGVPSERGVNSFSLRSYIKAEQDKLNEAPLKRGGNPMRNMLERQKQDAERVAPAPGSISEPEVSKLQDMNQTKPEIVQQANKAAVKRSGSSALEALAAQSEDGKAPAAIDPDGPKSSQPGQSPNMADGPMAEAASGSQYIRMSPGKKLDGLNPAFRKNFLSMAAEYGKITGKSILVTDGTRTRADQEAAYKANPQKAARPGFSMHEFGLAVDIDSKDLNVLDKMGLMKKYGFTRPVGGETWHMEASGTQINLTKARNDPAWAAEAIEDGLGRGGGGYGSVPKTPVGGRNPDMAMKILQLGTGTLVKNETKEDKITPVVSTVSSASSPGESSAANEPSAKMGPMVRQSSPVQAGIKASYELDKPTYPQDTEAKPSGTSTGQSIDPNAAKGLGLKMNIKDTIAKAARRAGVDPVGMQTMAAIESSLDPEAKAKTSSGEGLFQFLDKPWAWITQTKGQKYGITPETDRTDPEASTLMASESYKDNMAALKKIKPDAGPVEGYLAHFLGLSGATKFLSAPGNAIAADVLPKAAASNKAIFYESSGKPRTVAQVYQVMADKVNNKAKQFGINVPSSSGLKVGTAGSTTVDAANDPVTPQEDKLDRYKSVVSAGPGLKTDVQTSQTAKRNEMYQPAPVDYSQVSTSTASTKKETQVSFDSVGDTLAQSLDVQKQILAAMQALAKNMDPKTFAEVMQTAVKSSQPAEPVTPRPSGPGKTEVPKSSFDLRRTA